MNKTVTPKQLELTASKTRAELLQDTAPHIDFEGAAFKESIKAIDKIEVAEAATAVLAAAGPTKERDFEDFDWHDDPSVVLRTQPATAIYHNGNGHIVIRQERSWAQEDDPYVMISPENAVTFMEALAKRARE
jgi:ABC-type Zn uptake system ZnuABC Zn-binding protein ZnuA